MLFYRTLDVLENLSTYGVNVTLAGITIVFGMLILLVFIIKIFGGIMSKLTGKSKTQETSNKVESTPKRTVAPSVATNNVTDDELIAVITAAVYSLYEGSEKRPVIKVIRESTKQNVWNSAGVRQNMSSFF